MLNIVKFLPLLIVVGTIVSQIEASTHRHRHHFDESIIGGSNAGSNEAKFQVQVRQTRKDEYGILFWKWTKITTVGFCGGSLIDSTTVVTAAHCVEIQDEKIYVVVRYGTHKLDQSDHEDIRVSDIRIHPQYDNAVNDIAILKLSKPADVDSSSFIQLEKSDLPENTQTTIYGWGNYRFFLGSGQQPSDLQKGTLQTLSGQECQQILNNVNSGSFRSDAYKKVICAKNPQQSACQGDSGGPMISNNHLAGVTSMVQTGCPKGGLNIYTKVSAFNDWIEDNRD